MAFFDQRKGGAPPPLPKKKNKDDKEKPGEKPPVPNEKPEDDLGLGLEENLPPIEGSSEEAGFSLPAVAERYGLDLEQAQGFARDLLDGLKGLVG